MPPSTRAFDVVLVTHLASPYQVELFDRVAQLNELKLAVYYLYRTHPARNWDGQQPQHHARFFREEPDALTRAANDFRSAQLAVFNFYTEPPVPSLLRLRAASRLPWAFWGERPGYRTPIWCGKLVRRWRLRALYRSNAPIWGIGRFAVEGYQREFGKKRDYRNLPYFSDLGRFERIRRETPSEPNERVILFSGALIARKGVDLLARAFVRAAREFPQLKLTILGDGELRNELRHVLVPVASQVQFLGFRDWAELPEVYASADILCVPSRYDGWGLVVPEGLAAGLPVIGTDRTGAALEFLETGRNGWLIRAGDGDALHAALRQAAMLPVGQLEAMAVAARQTVREHSIERGATRFIAAARAAVARWGR